MSKSAENVKYKAAIYMRLSKEDGDKPESDSITNQKELIKQFLMKKPEITIVVEMVDDGYSGVFFERPAFIQMIEGIKNGKINCVVVKDLSRLGRNYIEAGKAITKLFPHHGVRFISINDNIDTTNEATLSDKLIIYFKNMMNDGYCRDISMKIRSSQAVKRKNGEFIGSFACYGYIKSKENKNKLVIDMDAALTVKDIFKWKIDGMSQSGIADRLNELGILSPSEYKKAQGQNFKSHFKTKPKALWSAMAVNRIIKNEIYTGVMEQGRVGTPNYKVKTRISKPKDEWVRVEGTHEAIISDEEFQLANNLLSMDTRVAPNTDRVYPFSGMIYCNDCGMTMVRKTVSSTDSKKYIYYICSSYKEDKNKCGSHLTNDVELTKSVFLSINYHIECISNIEELLAFVENLSFRQEELIRLEKQISQCRNNIDLAKKRKLELYEDFKAGKLDKIDFKDYKDIYGKKVKDTEKALLKLLEEQNLIRSNGTSEAVWIEKFKIHRKVTELSRNLVVSLIERITVFEGNKIAITYKYENEFESALDIYVGQSNQPGLAVKNFQRHDIH